MIIIIMFPTIVIGYDFNANSGLTTMAKSTGYENSNIKTPQTMISTVIEIALSFLGIFFLILTIYGGYTWMIARGNEQEIERASKIFQTAIIGLIVVIAAYAISWFMLDKLSKEMLKNTTKIYTTKII